MYTQFLLTNLTCDINQNNQKQILSMVHLKIQYCEQNTVSWQSPYLFLTLP